MDAAWIAASFVISAAGTAAAIGYARARRMVDLPGQRRSHTVPTLRGGGIGIVLAAAFALWNYFGAREMALLHLVGLGLVAGVGWWDDHRPLRASFRLAVHFLAALALVAPYIVFALSWLEGAPEETRKLAILALIGGSLLGAVWSINLHNFIDGINGLLALQSVWFFTMVGLLGPLMAVHPGWLPFALAAACLAFVPFNFPRARVFMGDVGSGAIGFLMFAMIWGGWTNQPGEPRWLALGLILASAPAIDATATLLARMLAGRRWYSAHREHLYQWLVRSGRSHARVVGYYMAWNLFIAAPASLIVARSPRLDVAAGVTALVYAAGLAAWCASRRAVLEGARR